MERTTETDKPRSHEDTSSSGNVLKSAAETNRRNANNITDHHTQKDAQDNRTQNTGNYSDTDALKREVMAYRRIKYQEWKEGFEEQRTKLEKDQMDLAAKTEELQQMVTEFSSLIQEDMKLFGIEPWNLQIETWKQRIQATQIGEQWEKEFGELNQGFSENEKPLRRRMQAESAAKENKLHDLENHINKGLDYIQLLKNELTVKIAKYEKSRIKFIQGIFNHFKGEILKNFSKRLSDIERLEDGRSLREIKFHINHKGAQADGWLAELQKERPSAQQIAQTIEKMKKATADIKNLFDGWTAEEATADIKNLFDE